MRVCMFSESFKSNHRRA